MRLKVKDKLVLSKQDFEDLLEVPVTGLTYEGNYFRVACQKDGRDAVVYFRCSDLKGAMNLDTNVFDYDDPKEDKKAGTFTFEYERTVIQRPWSKGNFKRLKKALKELMD